MRGEPTKTSLVMSCHFKNRKIMTTFRNPEILDFLSPEINSTG